MKEFDPIAWGFGILIAVAPFVVAMLIWLNLRPAPLPPDSIRCQFSSVESCSGKGCDKPEACKDMK